MWGCQRRADGGGNVSFIEPSLLVTKEASANSSIKKDLTIPAKNKTNKVSVPNETVSKGNVPEIDLGEVVYKVPDSMTVFKDYTVTVRINRKQGSVSITENLEGKVSRAVISTTSKMEVSLLDSSPDTSFLITKANSSDQFVDTSDYTEWKFTVRPIKHGKKSLNLVISMFRDGERKQKVYTDTIEVKDDVKGDFLAFISKYWQWILASLVLPFIIAIWKEKKK